MIKKVLMLMLMKQIDEEAANEVIDYLIENREKKANSILCGACKADIFKMFKLGFEMKVLKDLRSDIPNNKKDERIIIDAEIN